MIHGTSMQNRAISRALLLALVALDGTVSWISSPTRTSTSCTSDERVACLTKSVTNSLRVTLLSLTTTDSTAAANLDLTLLPKHSHSCRVCHQTFASRNALFRHLHRCPQCMPDGRDGRPSSSVQGTELSKPPNVASFRLAVQFGYCLVGTHNNSSQTISSTQTAGRMLEEAILNSTQQPTSSPLDGESRLASFPNVASIRILSSTQSSCAKLRPRSMQQDPECAAARDVLIVSGELSWTHRGDTKTITNSSSVTKAWISALANQLKDPIVSHSVHPLQIQVWSLKLLSPISTLHAERSCTQYVYHYLLPLSWLEGDNCTAWVLRHPDHGNPQASTAARPPALVRLKRALRSAENPRRLPPRRRGSLQEDPESKAVKTQARTAAGRFGGLAFKVRRPWHNFCDPGLLGQASPNQEPVWRCVDRARIVQFLHNDTAVIEVRGDAFLRHQVRYIVGTAVSMANEWLPTDTFDLSTRPEATLVPPPHLPCAPTGRLYLTGVRFHFDEMAASGLSLFESDAVGPVTACSASPEPVEWIQTNLWRQRRAVDVQQQEQDWLEHVQQDACPAARAFLKAEISDPETAPFRWPSTPLSPPPPEYQHVLRLLRDIVARDAWPETSTARSAVIRKRPSNAQENSETLAKKRGSFTVVNPLLVENSSFPLRNHLFPDLVERVFALERELTQGDCTRVPLESAARFVSPLVSHRPPSSHCAINCNAEFLPHVDSGRGAGQTLSMIVGLGDYRGGELSVEGETFDIRYFPLEFDGWKMRHWTRPLVGERFSLVWFTPE